MEIDKSRIIDLMKRNQHRYEGSLYHYTSPAGFLGIVGGDMKLWFTRYDFLNDKTEGKDVIDAYKKTCHRLYLEKILDEETYRNINDIKLDHVKQIRCEYSGEVVYLKRAVDYYLCSFSRNSDILPMWNYYLKNDKYKGYALGFKYLKESIASKYQMGYNFGIYSVIYDDEKKIKIISDKLTEIINETKKCDVITTKMQDFLNLYCIIFKNNKFESEQEVRAVIEMPNDEKDSIKYRMENEILKPFIEVEINKEALIEIMLPPRNIEDTEINDLREYLLQKKYEELNIDKSTIPI